MKRSHALLRARLARSAALGLIALLSGCDGPSDPRSAAKPPAPAKVEASAEGGPATLHLSAQAIERLGLETVLVERRAVPRTRTYGGTVMLPPDAAIVVTAPVAGTLRKLKEVPRIGASVKRGEELFALEPLLTPEREVLTPAERVHIARSGAELALLRADSAGALNIAAARLAAAEIAYERAERLLRDEAGSIRARDEAKAAREIAIAEEAAARSRNAALQGLELEPDPGQSVPMRLAAPVAGRITRIGAAPDEVVAAGAAICEITRFDVLWVRVPVYVGELASLNAASPARIGSLDGRLSGAEMLASPLEAPPSADSLAATIDLYYELPATSRDAVPSAHALAPGARVGATLELKIPENALVAPSGAMLFDVNGDAWVYAEVGERAFRRRRAEIAYAVGEVSVLVRGPEAGTRVVTRGAAELFGTEFGIGK